MSALPVEVVIDGGAVHADGFGDLGDCVLSLAVRADRLLHAADGGGLPGVQLGLAAPSAAARPGGVKALAGALDNELALELIDRAEDMEDQPPGRRGRVDLLAQDDQADAALAQLVGQRQEVACDEDRYRPFLDRGLRQMQALADRGVGLALGHLL